MVDTDPVEMDDDALDALLETGGTGVISMPAGDDAPPYTIPVSYGYDAVDRVFFFRLSFPPDSDKVSVVDGRTPVSFVTYAETDDGWQSVVATGRLEEIEESETPTVALDELGRVHIPLVDVFGAHTRTMTFRFFRLDPDELSGRKEVRTER